MGAEIESTPSSSAVPGWNCIYLEGSPFSKSHRGTTRVQGVSGGPC